MSADLIRVRFSGQSIALLNRAKALSPALGRKVESYGNAILARAGQLAQQAAQSSVPIDTGELRSHIQLLPANSFTDTVVISVAPVDHVNRGGKSFYRRGGNSNPKTHVIGSPALADLLNLGRSHTGKQFTRSRPSLAVSGFTSLSGKTADWEDEARNQFSVQLRRLGLSGR